MSFENIYKNNKTNSLKNVHLKGTSMVNNGKSFYKSREEIRNPMSEICP